MGMFASAKVLVGKETKGKASVPTISSPGLHVLAALNAVIKVVEAHKATVEAKVKAAMHKQFVAEAIRLKARPANYKGSDATTTASMQLRVRGANSPLSAEDIEMLKNNKISILESVAREETFVINPEFASNMEMLAKVEAALAGVVPENFFMKQEKVSKFVATEESVNEVCALKNEKMVSALLPLVTTLSIRATLDKGENAFKIVEENVGDISQEEAGEA